jgi:hypothetical protein
MAVPKALQGLTGFDYTGSLFSMLGSAFLVYFGLVLGPRFKEMLADLGSHTGTMTKLALTPWFPLVLALVGPSLIAVAFGAGLEPPLRRLVISAALFLSLGAMLLCVMSAYLPMFDLTGALEQ